MDWASLVRGRQFTGQLLLIGLLKLRDTFYSVVTGKYNRSFSLRTLCVIVAIPITRNIWLMYNCVFENSICNSSETFFVWKWHVYTIML